MPCRCDAGAVGAHVRNGASVVSHTLSFSEGRAGERKERERGTHRRRVVTTTTAVVSGARGLGRFAAVRGPVSGFALALSVPNGVASHSSERGRDRHGRAEIGRSPRLAGWHGRWVALLSLLLWCALAECAEQAECQGGARDGEQRVEGLPARRGLGLGPRARSSQPSCSSQRRRLSLHLLPTLTAVRSCPDTLGCSGRGTAGMLSRH